MALLFNMSVLFKHTSNSYKYENTKKKKGGGVYV